MNKIYRMLNLPNVTIALIGGQAVAYIMVLMQMLDPMALNLQADRVLAGEFWRLITFVIDPPASHPIWVLFVWYFFHLFGTSLEHYWGAGKYNLFLLVGFVLSISAAFFMLLTPGSVPVSNGFIMTSAFLAFSFYNPNFTILLFFIIPVKIKWLALLTWLGLAYALFAGDLAVQLMIGALLGNFFLFLGADVFRKLRYGHRQVSSQVQQIKSSREPFHTCAVCGITDKTHPEMKFRYCSDCFGSPGYCEAHIKDHEHKMEIAPEKEERSSYKSDDVVEEYDR